ncbi:MAG: MFS transporter [Deltaproteobacteria bacterium]|nr:MFS transporter [Deltaproteobacteria bacterium]
MNKYGKASKREIFGWAMFDFANSSFTTVIITVVFSAYFVSHVVGDDVLGVKYWGWSLSAANLLVMLAGPVVGAVADFTASKKRFLFLSYIVCVLFTALLFFVGKGDVLMAIVFVAVAHIGFSAGENFCSSFLPEIASPQVMGKISGYGWAFGYIGGLLSLSICFLIFKVFGQAELQLRFAFLSTAIFFLLSAIPTFLWLKERTPPQTKPAGQSYFHIGYGRVMDTFADLKGFGELIKFLFVFFLFSCGISTIVSFSAIYAESVVGFSKSDTLLFFIIVQVSSSLGAFAFGFIEDRLGAKKTIAITLVIWLAVVAGAWWSPGKAVFWVVGNLAGLAIGSSQSSSRALVGLFTPPSKSAEFFGLWGLSGKLAATVGIYSFSMMTAISGSMRSAILLTGLFFLLGLIGIFFINEEEGKMCARRYVNHRI